MAWSSLASNQMVSYTDAQTSGFNLQSGQSQVTSNQCMTKNDALTKYVLDSSYMSSYTSNQLVPKSTWVSGVVGNAFTFGPNVSIDLNGACSLSNTGYTVYSSSTTLTNGMTLFSDPSLTTPAFPNGIPYGNCYVKSGSSVMRITVNSSYCGVSSAIGTCNTTYAFSFGTVDSGSSTGACSGANTGRTLYSSSSSLNVGTNLYTDSTLISSFIPGDGTQSYYLHSGTNSYRVTSSGIIDLVTACSASLIYWTNTSNSPLVYNELVIQVNGTTVVSNFVNNNSANGSFTVNVGDTIYFTTEDTSGNPITYMQTSVGQGTTQIYYDTASVAYPYLSGTFTVSAGPDIYLDTYTEVI